MSDPKLFPKMLYSSEGAATMIVQTPEQEQAAGPGWAAEPTDAHRSPATAAPPPLQSGQEALIEAVAARTAEVVLAALKASAPDAPPPPPVVAKRGAKPSLPETLVTESGE